MSAASAVDIVNLNNENRPRKQAGIRAYGYDAILEHDTNQAYIELIL
jgi:hypothetical protein